MDTDHVNVAPSYPHYRHTDINDDVFIEENLIPGANGAGGIWTSTTHQYVGFGTVGVGAGNQTPADILADGGTRNHFIANVEVMNTEIANNGGFGGFEDGLVFAIGYLTRMNAEIGNASFGGNVGDDIRIYPQQSNEFLPPTSFNDGNEAHYYLSYDPVGYIDLIMGMADVNRDGTPDTTAGNGRAANSGTGTTGNGDQISILEIGTTQTIPISNTGVITDGRDRTGALQTEPVKARTRPVFLAGRLHGATEFGTVTGASDDNAVNDFFQNGIQQNIANQFDFQWEQIAAIGLFPTANVQY
jgi:hypothetical protein